MTFRRHFKFAAIAIGMVAFAQVTYAQTAGDGKIANMSVGAGSVRWDIFVPNSGGTVTVSFPHSRSIKKAFRAGAAAEIDLNDKQLEGLPDGVYNYELRLAPPLTAGQKETMMKARGDDEEPDAQRNLRKRAAGSLSQSGSFALVNGTIVGPGAVEGERTGANSVQPSPSAKPAPTARVSENTITRLRNHRFSLGMMPDVVFADDVIVQGSLCAGLDCVNNETFNFDTLRLKENNTRISFNDTSTGTGFPTEDWTIRANSSASGGGNFLAFVDRGTNSTGDESGTIVFEVDAGAPANALRVSSAGKVGIRTATPVLDLHVNATDTPALRMEQNNSGGFTAQTWDIGGNEANWFVRDVTGGSRLPFRIRPGAPTSSIDINASGLVGVGTASPSARLTVVGSDIATGSTAVDFVNTAGNTFRLAAGVPGVTQSNFSISQGGSAELVIQNGNGFVGIATTAPTDTLSVNGTASKPGGGSWAVFSDERLKTIKGNFNSGLSAVMKLQPLRYEYKRDNVLGLKSDGEHIGFGAQAVQEIIPEAVTSTANGYLQVNNDPILWTMLNAIKEQQQEITNLKTEIGKLKGQARKRRR